jgi:hypothetical protein
MKVVNKLQTLNYGNKHRLSLIKFRFTDVVTPTHCSEVDSAPLVYRAVVRNCSSRIALGRARKIMTWFADIYFLFSVIF